MLSAWPDSRPFTTAPQSRSTDTPASGMGVDIPPPLLIRGRGEQPPFVRDSLESFDAAVHEPDLRSGDQVPDGAGDEHFAGGGEGPDAGRDVDRDPADVAVHQLDLAAVHADPHLHALGAGRLHDRASASDPPRRAVEGSEAAVPERLHLAA